jgi:hypothetical protein
MRFSHPDNPQAEASFWLGVGATGASVVVPQFGPVVFGLPLGLGAVICGIIGLIRGRRAGGRSLAVTGLALGLGGPFAGVAAWILIFELFDIPY